MSDALSGTGIQANLKRKAMSIEAVVTRCGCGNPSSHPNLVCPTPRATEDLGIIRYWHINPFKLAGWYVHKYIGRHLGFTFKPVGSQ